MEVQDLAGRKRAVDWPEDAAEALALAERLALVKAADDAVANEIRRFWRHRRDGLPPIGTPRRLRRLMAAGELDETSAALARWRTRDGAVQDWRVLRLELSRLRGDTQGLAEAAQDAALDAGATMPLLCLLAEAAFDAGNIGRALELAEQALNQPPDPDDPPELMSQLHRIRLEALAVRGDEARLLAAIERAVGDLDRDPNAAVAVELSAAQDAPRLDALLMLMAGKWPASKLARQVLHMRRRATLSAQAEDLADGAPQLQARAVVAAVQGDAAAFSDALAGLQSLRPDTSRVNAVLHQALHNISPVPNPRRPIISPSWDQDVIISASGDTGITVLVFCGLARQVIVPIELIDAYLAQRGISAVYLTDRRLAAFMAGIESLGADWTATNAALKNIIERLGTKRLMTMGGSGGGPGAVSHGLALGAEAILGLSGIYSGDARVRAQMNDTRARLVAYKAQRSAGSAACHMPWHFEQTRHRPRVHLYFGEDFPVDRANAELLAPFENVTLFPLQAPCGHLSAWRLLYERRLDKAIDLALGA
jgi:tetratricopeptide (TPR) repeat protein